jgi:hypothetical protein
MNSKELADAFRIWRDDPMTQGVFYIMQSDIDRAMRSWSDGNYGTDTESQAATLGCITAYRKIIIMTGEEFAHAVEQEQE